MKTAEEFVETIALCSWHHRKQQIESRDAEIHALYAPVVEALRECKQEFRMLDKVDINTTHWGNLVDMIDNALAAIKEIPNA